MQTKIPLNSKEQPSAITKPKSILVVPSRANNQPDDVEGVEETEITAQISVPHEGGWGWVVVFATFWSIFILDGIAFTFGSVLGDIVQELEIEESLVAIINSIAVALYFIAGPLTSALINRFGFRAVMMSGAMIDSVALFLTYFLTSYSALCLFYGGFAGIGYCFIQMSSTLVVGFYFEKLRSLALSLAATGSSAGVGVMYPINAYLVQIAGWRTLTLLHSGMFGIIYYLAMTYRPLISLTVSQKTDDPTRTVTYLPSLSTQAVKLTPSRMHAEGLLPTVTEKLFSAVSNVNFPTAADVVDEGKIVSSNQAGTSTAAVSKLTLTAHGPRSGMSQRQIKQVQSMISRTSVQDKIKRSIEIILDIEPPKKQKWWSKLFKWEEHIPQSRPMYRDDAFYEGKLEKLPVYQKSIIDAGEAKTGLEYQLAVSRAVTTADLQERRGMFTTAVRRILATMMDPKLLKRRSFLLFGASAFLTYLGFLVPYVFIVDRNRQAGIDEAHCTWYVSVIGVGTAIGRLVIGAIACKLSPIKLNILACIISGSVSILSNLSFNAYYQYVYCFIYGFFIASIASLRSLVLVNLYGLEKLTNATGMMLFFAGIGCCLCTPVASVIKSILGFPIAFYLSGSVMCLGGLLLLPLEKLCKKEHDKESQNTEEAPVMIGPQLRPNT